MRTIVSRHFRQFTLSKYPELAGNEPFLRFFRYLCFSSFFDADSGQIVIPTKTMAEEFYKQSYTHRFNGKATLEEFRERVLPKLTWTDARYGSGNATAPYKGKARQIVDLGFDAEMQEALRQECLKPSADQVDFVMGLVHRREDRYQKAAEDTAQYETELGQFTLNATQTLILDYLREVNAGHLFLRKLRDNQDAIQAAIGDLSPELQTIQYRILANVQQNPNVHYLPSERERTCRLSPRGDSLLGLKKTVRRAATKGWVECDLRSSQFAVLAARLQAPISQAFIASGDSIWREFYRHTHGIHAEPPATVKSVFKEAMYSLCFGKGQGKLSAFLREQEVPGLLKHPILRELFKLRDHWFEQIAADGGAGDVWGQWHAIDESVDPKTGKGMRWAGSIAATVIQSIEMEIVAPIFEVALKHGKSDQFGICLFAHDGATLSFTAKEKVPRAQTKLKTAVEKRARELGVSTVLEFTQL